MSKYDLNLKMINKKRGQSTMSMPFGTIFAIFLIIVFIVFAFMAVGGFLDIGKSTNVGIFYDDLQSEVDEALRSQSSESSFDIDLPEGIKQVCFANLSSTITAPGPAYDSIKNYEVYIANTFLVPPEYAQNMQWKLIEHLDIEEITKTKNPYCVDIRDGLKIKKDFYSRLVSIE